MQVHYIAFRKRPNIRVEFAIAHDSAKEARKIAKQEMKPLRGFTYAGSN